MSLKISDFDQFAALSDKIDFVTLRLTEQKELYLNFTASDGQTPVDITTWNFVTSYYDMTAVFAETATGLTSVTNITLLTATAMTDPNLSVVKLTANMGKAALQIPATVTSAPAASVTLDSNMTLMKLIKITATYASPDISGFNIVDEYQIGIIVRWGG